MSKFIKTTKVQAFLRKLSTKAEKTAETIAIPAGNAGTVKNFYLPSSPVANSNGTDVGGYGDSSVSFATGVFDVEVANNTADADLANGEYWINYLTGEGRGKKKTTGTSEAVTYKHFVQVESGGGSAGAGDSALNGNSTYYAKPSGTNADATVAYTSATTITVTGLPWTFTKYDITKIEQISSSGTVTTYTDKGDFSVSSGVITVTGASFSSGDNFVVTFSGPPRTENTPTQSTQTTRLNPESQNFSPTSLVDDTNLTAATHDYTLSMDGFKDLSLSGKLVDADNTITMKVYGMNDDDTTNGDYIQLYGYNDDLNSTTNSWTITNGTLTFGISFNNCNYKNIKVEVVCGGATNTVIVKARRKAL